MANFEVTLPISGTVRIAIEADNKAEAIAKALAGEGHSELNEWQVDGTPQDAIAKAFDANWEEIKDAIADIPLGFPDFESPFKVDYRFPNHPEWNTTENWQVDDFEPKNINDVANSINSKRLKVCSTNLNPTVDLSDFKQSAVISNNVLTVTFV